MVPLETYVNAKHVITVLSVDDWHWYFVEQDLVWEGHTGIREEIVEAILKKMLEEGEIVWQTEWLYDQEEGQYIGERLCMNISKLSDLKDKFGYEPENIHIYPYGRNEE